MHIVLTRNTLWCNICMQAYKREVNIMNEKEKTRMDTEAFIVEVLKKVPKGVARERVLELTGLAAIMTAAQAKHQSNPSAVT